MTVHYEISKKVNEKLKAIEKYKQFDIQREMLISDELQKYLASNLINLDILNKKTKEMNLFAIKHQLPQRKIVTREMFLIYAKKQHL